MPKLVYKFVCSTDTEGSERPGQRIAEGLIRVALCKGKLIVCIYVT